MMLSFDVKVQMTRESEDKDPVDLPTDVELDGSTLWIYVSREAILEALALGVLEDVVKEQDGPPRS